MASGPQLNLVKNDLTDDQLEYYLSKDEIAIDGEMMGLNINRDRLCLVQIGDENRKIVLVQVAKGQTEAPNLKKLMEAESVNKIFHYARTDVAWLKHWLGIEVKNVFCTKIASKLARTYTDKHGLRDLCREIVGKDLNKQQQSSDWGQEYLSHDQQQYAATDVYHLIKAKSVLSEMLRREGNYELALKCINVINIFTELDIKGYESIFEH